MNSFEKRLLLLKKDEKESFISLVKQLSNKEKTVLFDIIDSKLRKLQSTFLQKSFNLKYLQNYIKEEDDEDDEDDSSGSNSSSDNDSEELETASANNNRNKLNNSKRDNSSSCSDSENEKVRKEKEEERVETKIIPKKPLLKLNQPDNNSNINSTDSNNSNNINDDSNNSNSNNISTSSLLVSSPTSSFLVQQQQQQQSLPKSPVQRIQSVQNLMRSNSLMSSSGSLLFLKPLLLNSNSSGNLDDINNSNNNNNTSNNNGSNNNNSAPTTVSTQLILPNNLESVYDENNKIGEGGQSIIYKYMGCALKKFKGISNNSSNSEIINKSFENEVSILEKLDHCNIIKIITSSTIEKIILLEYMDQGSLENYPPQQQQPLDSKQYSPRQLIDAQIQLKQLPNPLKVIQDMQSIVDAMIYLHYEKSIIHLDLKPSNILKNSNGDIKLIDFGISYSMVGNSSSTGINMGSYRYTSPELFNSSSFIINRANDVYSFGIVLWELLNWRLPYENLSREQIKNIKNEMERESHLPLDHLPKGIQDLIRLCWKQDPSIRPDFKDVKSRLEEIILNDIPNSIGKLFWKNCCSFSINNSNSNNNSNNQFKVLESIPWQDFKSYLLDQIKVNNFKLPINNNNNSNTSNNTAVNSGYKISTSSSTALYSSNKLSPYNEYIFDYIKYILMISDEKNDSVTVSNFARFFTLFSPISSSLFRSVQNFCDIQGMYGYCVKKDFIPSTSMLNSLNKIGYLLFLDPIYPNVIYLKIKSSSSSSSKNSTPNDISNNNQLIDFTIRIKVSNHNVKTFQCHGHSSSTLSGLLRDLQQVIENHNKNSSSSKKSGSGIIHQRTPISEIKDRYINGFYFNQNRIAT